MSEQREQSAGKASLSAWFTVAVLLVMYILSLADRQIIALMVTPLQRDLGLSDVQIGLLEGLAFAARNALRQVSARRRARCAALWW